MLRQDDVMKKFLLLYIVSFIFLFQGINKVCASGKAEENETYGLGSSILTTHAVLSVEIFDWMENKSLLEIRKVCKSFRDLIDQKLALPFKKYSLTQIMDAFSGKIPDKLKVPHWLSQEKQGNPIVAIRESLSSFAYNHYRCHYDYYSLKQRERSFKNLDSYRMLMYVAYKLGNPEAFRTLNFRLSLIRDELLDFPVHLPRCSPSGPNLKSEIYASLCEQIALINPLERPYLALAYKEGSKVPQDLERSVYWETYKTDYDFPENLFEAELFKKDE